MTEEHDHHHSHDHHHGHHSHGDRASNLSFEQKLVKRIEHWIAHNADHAETYREWADQTTEKGLTAVGALLKEAARITQDISHVLEEAVGKVKAE